MYNTFCRLSGSQAKIVRIQYKLTKLASFTNDTNFEVRVVIHRSMILKSFYIEVAGYCLTLVRKACQSVRGGFYRFFIKRIKSVMNGVLLTGVMSEPLALQLIRHPFS